MMAKTQATKEGRGKGRRVARKKFKDYSSPVVGLTRSQIFRYETADEKERQKKKLQNRRGRKVTASERNGPMGSHEETAGERRRARYPSKRHRRRKGTSLVYVNSKAEKSQAKTSYLKKLKRRE